jgi:hypothetical protein
MQTHAALDRSTSTATPTAAATVGRSQQRINSKRGQHRGTDMTTNKQRYDDIGGGNACTRQEDPRVRDSILGALGVARTIVNVGAGQAPMSRPTATYLP